MASFYNITTTQRITNLITKRIEMISSQALSRRKVYRKLLIQKLLIFSEQLHQTNKLMFEALIKDPMIQRIFLKRNFLERNTYLSLVLHIVRINSRYFIKFGLQWLRVYKIKRFLRTSYLRRNKHRMQVNRTNTYRLI